MQSYSPSCMSLSLSFPSRFLFPHTFSSLPSPSSLLSSPTPQSSCTDATLLTAMSAAQLTPKAAPSLSFIASVCPHSHRPARKSTTFFSTYFYKYTGFLLSLPSHIHTHHTRLLHARYTVLAQPSSPPVVPCDHPFVCSASVRTYVSCTARTHTHTHTYTHTKTSLCLLTFISRQTLRITRVSLFPPPSSALSLLQYSLSLFRRPLNWVQSSLHTCAPCAPVLRE